MKVILTGTSGFVGREILHQSLAHPSISNIVVLTRRPIQITHTKLKVLIHNDFLAYNDSVIKELEGAESCIWSIGTTPSKSGDLDAARRTNVDYAKAAAEAFANKLAPQLQGGKKFRFVYLSGTGSERNQEQKLWFAQDFRRMRGDAENKIIDANSSKFHSTIFRPGLILSKNNIIPSPLLSWAKTLKVDEIAAVMVDAAVGEGDGYGQFVELDGMGAKGRILLRQA